MVDEIGVVSTPDSHRVRERSNLVVCAPSEDLIEQPVENQESTLKFMDWLLSNVVQCHCRMQDVLLSVRVYQVLNIDSSRYTLNGFGCSLHE